MGVSVELGALPTYHSGGEALTDHQLLEGHGVLESSSLCFQGTFLSLEFRLPGLWMSFRRVHALSDILCPLGHNRVAL